MPVPERPDPDDAARSVISEKVPRARSAILSGSVVTGHATSASDLDIVVIADDPSAPFRRSLRHAGWPSEVFVHTEETIHGFWRLKGERLRPALALMCARGRIVLDTDGSATAIQQEAGQLLEAGPAPLTSEELDLIRYGVTDSLDDLLAPPREAERLFILPSLIEGLCDLAMENRRAFRGSGKWMLRMAEEADPGFAADLLAAIDSANKRDCQPLEALVRAELAMVGGPLFDGYWADGRPLLESG
jgi:nucleotidyltransferase-like protein